jgi:hypothetical protein
VPSQVEPLVNVKELETFREDQGAVERALAHARRFASKEPFKDRKEAGEAADAIKALGNVRRDAEERKLGITAEWRASTNAVNTEYKELLSLIGAAEQALKQKGLAFKKAEEARVVEQRRQEQARLDREAEAAAKEAQAAAEVAADDDDPELQQLAEDTRREAAAAAVATPPPPMAPPKQVRGGFASLGSRTIYKHEIVDGALVPARNKVVSDASIKADIAAEKAAAKAENRAFNLELIPGVRIYSEEIPVSR